VSGIRTVPQVFVDGTCVGGCDATLAALRDGSMKRRLAECGVVAGS
jgi:glutaredoxin-related protein